jgi:hypothetical protein
MYNEKIDHFTIENNIDYLNTKKEKEKIDNFMLTIDTMNYPYFTETLEQLEEISDRIFAALSKYDKKRLKKINK